MGIFSHCYWLECRKCESSLSTGEAGSACASFAVLRPWPSRVAALHTPLKRT